MKPLLRIHSIPIKIEAQAKRASLEYKDAITGPTVDVTRNKGRANIQTTPAKVHIDSTEARANAGLKSAPRFIGEAAQSGIAAAQESAGNYSDEGRIMRDSHGKGDPIIDIAVSRANAPIGNGANYRPKQDPEISVEPGSISFDYQMDTLTFDWNVHAKPQLEYVPASIEFSVTQYPDVIIEYLGEPIYVPASANPNYQNNA